jgi:hypothetical protein
VAQAVIPEDIVTARGRGRREKKERERERLNERARGRTSLALFFLLFFSAVASFLQSCARFTLCFILTDCAEIFERRFKSLLAAVLNA